jgi:hypothetical protein
VVRPVPPLQMQGPHSDCEGPVVCAGVWGAFDLQSHGVYADSGRPGVTVTCPGSIQEWALGASMRELGGKGEVPSAQLRLPQ